MLQKHLTNLAEVKASPAKRPPQWRSTLGSLLLVAVLSAASLGLLGASALPRNGSESSAGSAPAALQLSLPCCSSRQLLPAASPTAGSIPVSELMLLHYWAIPAGLDNLLTSLHSVPLVACGSRLNGPDPNLAFVGKPGAKDSVGCLPGPVVHSLENFLPPSLCAKDGTGISLDTLTHEDIAAGEPALVWLTAGMKRPGASRIWMQPDKQSCLWPENAACMVLVGYDSSGYWLIDPTGTAKPQYWKKALVQARYAALGLHCLTVQRQTSARSIRG